ncbi:MAG: hypothetical protein DDT32_01610 [Syntrophomonadaceae bacterium]|nr:hypothetical protein [Bacillota bacterium]MBT9147844.1 hypothetical protein [Bacillota bacterium]
MPEEEMGIGMALNKFFCVNISPNNSEEQKQGGIKYRNVHYNHPLSLQSPMWRKIPLRGSWNLNLKPRSLIF